MKNFQGTVTKGNLEALHYSGWSHDGTMTKIISHGMKLTNLIKFRLMVCTFSQLCALSGLKKQ